MENLKKMNLDKFDLAILKVLQQNARASLNDIGAAVGLSSTPCWNRIKRMESAGVIRGYTVDIDPASLGFMDTVIVHVTLESHSEETLYEFGRALAQIPEVLEAFLVSGDYDYYIRIAVRDTRDYERCCANSCTEYRDPAQQVLLCAAPVEGDDAAADGRGNGLGPCKPGMGPDHSGVARFSDTEHQEFSGPQIRNGFSQALGVGFRTKQMQCFLHAAVAGRRCQNRAFAARASSLGRGMSLAFVVIHHSVGLPRQQHAASKRHAISRGACAHCSRTPTPNLLWVPANSRHPRP